MVTPSSILARNIPWTEEHGGLQSWCCKESDITEHTHARYFDKIVFNFRKCFTIRHLLCLVCPSRIAMGDLVFAVFLVVLLVASMYTFSSCLFVLFTLTASMS